MVLIRVVLVIILLIYPSFANTKQQYKHGITLYKQKKYQESYDIFKKLFVKDFKNKNINFYLALNAFELGLYEEALSAYERILIADPNALRIKLEYAKTLFAMKDYESAKKEFEKIKQEKIPKAVQNNIDYFLALIDNNMKRLFVNGSIGVSLIYDNNINSGIKPNTYLIPKYDVNATGDLPIKDWANQEVVTLSTKYDIGEKSGTYFSNDFLIFAKHYKKYHDKNLALVSTTPKIGYNSANYDISLSIPLDRIETEHEISTTSISFQPSLNYVFTRNFSLYTYLKYQKKFNKQFVSKDNDSKIKEISNTFMYKTFSTNLSYTKEEKIRGERTDINKNIKKLSLNYTYVINTKNNLGLSFSLLKTIYNDNDDNFLNNREDLSRNYNLSFNRNISSIYNLNIGLSKTENLSNQAPFVNKKDTFTIGITRSF
jgi:tetratricopeptide (TPR) repeat protein